MFLIMKQPQSYIVEDTEYIDKGTPVLTANKAFILGYTSETEGIYDKGDCIIFDDFTLVANMFVSLLRSNRLPSKFYLLRIKNSYVIRLSF